MISQRGRVHAHLLADAVARRAGDLGVAVPDVADQLPVDQVPGGIDGQARERDKRRGHAEECLVDVHAARVRVPPGQDGVVVRRIRLRRGAPAERDGHREQPDAREGLHDGVGDAVPVAVTVKSEIVWTLRRIYTFGHNP